MNKNVVSLDFKTGENKRVINTIMYSFCNRSPKEK